MAKSKIRIKTRQAMQWHVERGIHIRRLARVCEDWTARGWNVHTIFGPHGNVAVVFHRMLVL